MTNKMENKVNPVIENIVKMIGGEITNLTQADVTNRKQYLQNLIMDVESEMEDNTEWMLKYGSEKVLNEYNAGVAETHERLDALIRAVEAVKEVVQPINGNAHHWVRK